MFEFSLFFVDVLVANIFTQNKMSRKRFFAVNHNKIYIIIYIYLNLNCNYVCFTDFSFINEFYPIITKHLNICNYYNN